MNNVSGISSSGSQKAMDMYLKCQYLSEINDGRGIVFATGTPVSNTMCELYVMQLYLQKQALERMDIHHFDSWATNFGEVTTALELTVEGSGFRFKSRFNKFTNLPELMTTFREVADVQTADMLSCLCRDFVAVVISSWTASRIGISSRSWRALWNVQRQSVPAVLIRLWIIF